MTDRIRHINTRNLVVCETFDDFAETVEKADFTVEDVVGYVTSLANVYYWLNIESIWGAIGFVWSSPTERLSREEALKYPNPLYRLEQVTAEGENIEMDEEWLYENRTFKGTGIFNATTVPFSHIPKVPDGHRITAINGSMLNNINLQDGVLYIDKSNWANLANIDNLVSRNMTLYADLDDSNIVSTTHIINNNRNNGSCKLYLKADLSNITADTELVYCYSYSKLSIIAANEYYKDLNIPIGTNIDESVSLQNVQSFGSNGLNPVFQWEGEGPCRLEYFFNIKDYNIVFNGLNKGNAFLNSLNGEIYINNYRNLSDTQGLFFCLPYFNSTLIPEVYDVTIDCTNGVSDVRIDYDLSRRGEDVSTFIMNPIKYIGNVTSIGSYNPCIKVENDEWPEYNQSLVNKLNIGCNILKSARLVNLTRKCPYTVDCSNLNAIRLLTYSRVTCSNDFVNKLYGKYYDYFPNVIVDENKVYDYITVIPVTTPIFKYPIKKVKAVTIILTRFDAVQNYRADTFFDEDTQLTATRFPGNSARELIRLYDCSKPVFILKKLSDTENLSFWEYIAYKEIGDYVNYIAIDATKEELKAGFVRTLTKIEGLEVRHPFIMTNTNTDYANATPLAQHYTNFREGLVYRSTIAADAAFSYPNYTDQELIEFAECFEDTGDHSVEYAITLRDYIYDRMGGDNSSNPLMKDGMTLIEYLISLGYKPSRLSQ